MEKNFLFLFFLRNSNQLFKHKCVTMWEGKEKAREREGERDIEGIIKEFVLIQRKKFFKVFLCKNMLKKCHLSHFRYIM
jgi:hypothetical protein